MKCADARKFVSPYLDSELDERASFEIARHVEACAACSQYYAFEAKLERRIEQIVAPAAAASTELWHRAEARIEQRNRTRAARFGALAIVMCAAAAAAAFMIVQLWRPGQASGALCRALASMHKKVLDGTETPHAACASGGEVDAFFADRINAKIWIPEGVEVEGARLCNYNGEPLALVFARRRGAPISLFTLERAGADAAEDARTFIKIDSVTAAVEVHDGVIRGVAAALSAEEIGPLLNMHK